MSDTTDDPVIVHLRERKAELLLQRSEVDARLAEISDLLDRLSDGRTRVRRRLKEVPAPDSPPEVAA
jgi:hypothetical protein